VGIHIRTSYRWCWWLRNAALSYEMQRQLEGTVEADELYHTAGQKGQAKQGGKKHIPSDLVVDSWASSVESRLTLDFLYVPDA
jgi:hypothetical protein